MLRIRFHGRGGHGVKTASRILGTAGFLAGLHCQDSPIYGAERRGAAVAAFTRIAREPIRERGAIDQPDLVLVADETLLSDPSAGVLRGLTAAAALWINTDRSDFSATLSAAGILMDALRVIPFDLTGRTLAALGRAAALSAGLAAAAARLSGVIPAESLLSALRSEFAELHVAEDEVTKNLAVAREVFDALPTLEWNERPALATTDQVVPIGYQGVIEGTPSVLAPGNSERRKTGAWRVERPVVDADRCTRCGLCFVLCPDGAVSLDEHGYPVIDYDHCKGCLICQRICPVKAVSSRRETRAW